MERVNDNSLQRSKNNRNFFSLLHHIRDGNLNQQPVPLTGTKEIDNGGNSDGDPPLPIPNREVKPVSADGTAIPSGRVGSRQPSETFRRNSEGLFLYNNGGVTVLESRSRESR